MTASTTVAPARILRAIRGHATADGDGVKLTRVIGGGALPELDPFLLLDEFGTDRAEDYIGGFPSHPHRGFETVTYMLDGRMRHKDNHGNEGLLTPGGVQWMTAGRGVIHSELPEQQEGRMEGFQLWLNLPGRDKMRDPWYRDIPAAEIPLVESPGVQVRLIAGERHGVAGAMQRDVTQPLYLDVQLAPGADFEQALPDTHNAFLYVYRGGVRFDSGCLVGSGRMAILANTPGSDGLRFTAAEEGARLILVAGQPLNEPIAQYGPFVMNTEGELLQAVRDFQAGTFA